MSQKFVNSRKVAILLSCYNGIKFLPNLLDSILAQDNQDFTLYIRDDGSTDCTSSLLQEYAKCVNVVIFPKGENLGSKRSFLLMLDAVDSEYYMFCDQDDVWMPHKVSASLNALVCAEQANSDKPIVVHTDLQLVDGTMATIASSYWQYCNIPVDMPHSYRIMCHYNDVTGCAMIFNRLAQTAVKPHLGLTLPPHVYHDYLVALAVMDCGGIIIPLHKTTIWFRRHGNNETNPLAQRKSILQKPNEVQSYIKEQYNRYLFYRQIRPCSFTTFICNKIVTTILVRKWKKKRV